MAKQTEEQELAQILNAKQVKSNGSVYINGASTYSGADIKVIVNIYDGGKLANQRKESLINEMKLLTDRISKAQSELAVIDRNFLSSGITTSANISRSDYLNKENLASQNALVSITEEVARIEKLKPNVSTKVLAELQTLSLSSHREKWPVRSFGTGYVKSYTRGQRSIAGTMIFTTFDQHVFYEFLESHASDFDAQQPSSSAILDQIPPVDIVVSFANEMGQTSQMTIYGVEFMNESQTMSIEDLFIENIVQYVARDYDPMRRVGQKRVDENNRLANDFGKINGSSLLEDPDYAEVKNRISPFAAFKKRGNPFL
jgi:hypothetical protein